ncbi:RICIN domain-containing protein [Kitasatospora sp. NPDC088783]|uniref:RICIN domain-containing protein n=1 Tax=Kitasatospora sp. NPDC088783 TaxID=3364077 RepID=UPI0038062B18
MGAAAATLAIAATVSILPTGDASATTFGSRLINVNSGKCLEVTDWSTANGAGIRQWDCTGGANQNWTWDGQGRWVNQYSGKCMEIKDWSTGPGGVADQWDCTAGANQKWDILSADGGSYQFIQNRNSGLYLEILGWNTQNGAVADQWSLSSGANQKWNYT